MKLHFSTQSLKTVVVQTFRLLSPSQRKEFLKISCFSIVQASFEVLSIAAVIPLFYLLINNPTSQSFPFLQNIAGINDSFSWSFVLVTIVIAFLVKNILGVWLTARQSHFVRKVSVPFSERLYRQFYGQRWTDHLHHSSAEVARKIKTTPSDFANYVLQGHLSVTTDLCICMFMLGGMLWFDYRIILIVLSLLVPTTIVYNLFRKKIVSKLNVSFRELTPIGNIVLTQGIDSFSETKIYHKENFFIKAFMEVREATALHLANLTTATALPARLFEVTAILIFATLIIYARLYLPENENVILWLGLLSLSMYRIIPSVNRMFVSLSQIQAYSYSVTELKESFHSVEPSSDGKQDLPFKRNIHFENVSFQYTRSPAEFRFVNVSVTLNKGDFVLLEGPSGTGKTTFIHLLAGLLTEYSGAITIDDEILSTATRPSWQNKLGFSPQAPIVLHSTFMNNIAFGEINSEVDIERVNAAVELSELDDFINELPLKLQTEIGENGLTLSGGQRQRLILARALYRNPEILLLDEVTNQLDEDNKLKIFRSLKQLSKSGKTIILASHDHAARRFANRILCFENKTVREIFQNNSITSA